MNKDKTTKLVLTGLMICLTTIATMIIKIPVPMTQGYVHLGDSMVFMSVIVLGRNRGALAAGLGSGLADLFSGYAYWAPWTFVIKLLMAFLMGLAIDWLSSKRSAPAPRKLRLVEIIAMTIAGCEMVIGYYVAAGMMYGNWEAPILSIPWNIGQFVIGMVITVALSAILCETPVKKFLNIHA